MATNNIQTPKGTPTRKINHKAKPNTRATIMRRMMDGKGSGTKKIGQGCKNDKTTTKSATTITVTITIRAKQQIAGNNSNGTRESGFERINGPTNRRKNALTQHRTRAGIPGGHKVNNGRHRSNLSQMKTVPKARK